MNISDGNRVLYKEMKNITNGNYMGKHKMFFLIINLIKIKFGDIMKV